MKTLLVLRHAKAQPDSPLGDWARELAGRGRRDAPVMGELIRQRIGRPDAIVSSDAHRARQTAELVAEAMGFTLPIALVHDVYNADLDSLLGVVRSLPEHARTILLVGHNPGMEALVAALAGIEASDVRLPTAGLAHLELGVDRWLDVGPKTGRLLGLDTPKEAGG
ncbi:MAG: phosphohistidine phosphatase [Thermomicrobiales bacterium]|jgi:phosphohistidine phosphatase|nr:phosphohistidine phosphatase [Thermomicrobiales bacterium]